MSMSLKCALLLAAAAFPCFLEASSTMNPLASYRWNARLILVTLDPGDRESFEEQAGAETDGIRERHLRILPVGVGIEHPATDVLAGDAQAKLVERYGLNPGTTELLLIGKDGGLKERIPRIDFAYLFDAIDQMPMRRNEMRD